MRRVATSQPLHCETHVTQVQESANEFWERVSSTLKLTHHFYHGWIDRPIRCMVMLLPMNQVQERLKALHEKRWTWAAIATELGLTVNAIEKQVRADRRPANEKATLQLLDQLILRKHVPKQRRHTRRPGQEAKP